MVNDRKKIVILGGGTAGWMAANLFIHHWREQAIDILLVESPDVATVGVGEGSTPTLKRFFKMIGVTEAQWMPQCDATYKLNIAFEGWSPESGVRRYSHPFPSQLDIHTKRAFMVNCQTRRLGLSTHTLPDDFLLNGVLAKQRKGPQTPSNFPFGIEYGYHFNAHLLGKFLAELAQQRGVKLQRTHIHEITQHLNGDIKSLVTRDGQHISGDLFVDCTGFSSLLMQKTLGVPFHSYQDNLFNDAAVVMTSPRSDVIPVETTSTAMSAGWCWKIPLQSRFGNGYVYSSQFIDADQAEVEFRHHLNMLTSEHECRHLKMKVGSLAQHWVNNCLGLGLSQGFIEPLEATALHLVQISIELFIKQFEQGKFTSQYQAEFNHEITGRFAGVRDYIVAHYKLNTRNDSEYWRANRNNNNISDSLSSLLNVWFSRQDLLAEIEQKQLSTHFDAVSWHCLLAGYGAFPTLHPNQPGRGDLYHEQAIAQFLKGCSLNFAQHEDNLSQLTK